MLHGILLINGLKTRRFKQLRSPQARSKSLWLTLPIQTSIILSRCLTNCLAPIDFLATCGFPDKQEFVLMTSTIQIYTILYCICDKLSPALNLQNSCDFLIESFSMDNNNILPILIICSSLSMGQIIIQQPKNFRPCLKSVFRKRISKLNFPDVSSGNRGLPDLC